jgi:hypothetical protein
VNSRYMVIIWICSDLYNTTEYVWYHMGISVSTGKDQSPMITVRVPSPTLCVNARLLDVKQRNQTRQLLLIIIICLARKLLAMTCWCWFVFQCAMQAGTARTAVSDALPGVLRLAVTSRLGPAPQVLCIERRPRHHLEPALTIRARLLILNAGITPDNIISSTRGVRSRIPLCYLST